MYGNAAVMGFTPRDVDRMSFAQLMAAVDGWARAHGREDKPPPPTDEEYYAAMRMG